VREGNNIFRSNKHKRAEASIFLIDNIIAVESGEPKIYVVSTMYVILGASLLLAKVVTLLTVLAF
jgi:hypothetical protein